MNAQGKAMVKEKKAGSLRWPLGVVALLAAHMSLMSWAVVKISKDRNGAVIPNYYQKSLKWDEERRAAMASEARRGGAESGMSGPGASTRSSVR